MIKLITFLLLASLLSFTPYGSAQTSPDTAKLPEFDLSLRRLQGEIARAAESAGGIVGMSAVHLESGRTVGFHSGERFPMASAYKIPIAVQLLCRVDRGEISLSQMVELQPRDLRPGSGMIAGLLKAPGVALSVRNLLELMLLISDNTATDLLLRMAGGPDAVTARVRSLGITDLDVSRPTVNLIAEQSGYLLPPEAEWNPELFQKLDESVTEESEKGGGQKIRGGYQGHFDPGSNVGTAGAGLPRGCVDERKQGPAPGYYGTVSDGKVPPQRDSSSRERRRPQDRHAFRDRQRRRGYHAAGWGGARRHRGLHQVFSKRARRNGTAPLHRSAVRCMIIFCFSRLPLEKSNESRSMAQIP